MPKITSWAYQERFIRDPQNGKRLSENKFKFEWKVPKVDGERSILEMSRKGNKTTFQNNSLEREKFSGSMRVTGTAKIESTVNVDKNGKVISNKPYYKENDFYFRNKITNFRTFESSELNRSGINRGIRFSRGVDGIGEVNRWVPLLADIYYQKTEKMLAFRNELERDYQRETKFPVPPKPEDLPKEREKLLRFYGTDQKGKIQVNEIMRDLEIKSHAFWNR